MIEIRLTEERDHLAVLAVAESLPEWFNSDARQRAIPIDLRFQAGFVALAEGNVVGFITLYVAEGRLNIGWLGVAPEFHGQGIGTRLLLSAEEYGRQRGLTELATYTLGEAVDYVPYEATRRFYLRRGFAIYQRNTTDNDACPEEIRISKPIALPQPVQ